MRDIKHQILVLIVSVLISACGGGGGAASGSSGVQKFSIGGSVTGLVTGQQIVLLDNAGDSLTVSSNTGFTFAGQIAQNGSYAVTVGTQPNGQVCTVSNGAGAGVIANINNVSVTCSMDTNTISGSVTGLNNGQQVTLNNNGADPITIASNTSFSFSTPIAYGASYSVTVSTQPAGQICTVSNGTGAGVITNITNVLITCSTNTYAISGTVSGLSSGQQVTLDNNGANPTTVISNTTFSFTTPVAYGGSYAITVGTQPTGQTCTVSNGTGTNVATTISNISVTCASNTYTISGTVTGLLSGQQVTLNNNGANPTTVTANTSFSFATPIAYGSNYAVTVGTQPTGATCTVSNASGSAIAANVSNVAISCTSNETSLHSFGSVANDGANPFGSLTLGTDGNFYGETEYGGANNAGIIFKVTPAGLETILYSFGSTGSDGVYPYGGLTLGTDGNFYGMTMYGGSSSNGTIFKITPAGAYTSLYAFGSITDDGAIPLGSLTLGPDGNFYGTTSSGGTSGNGTIFSINPTTYAVTQLHSFTGIGTDGTSPASSLILGNDNNFYGVTRGGGENSKGTIFKITPAGAYTHLYSFGGAANDAVSPFGSLVLGVDGNFYGMTIYGGTAGDGSIFKVTPAGVETVLYSFDGGAYFATNLSDGANPYGSLALGNDGSFYGMTSNGGTNAKGTIFKVTPAGIYTHLYSFGSVANDGANPDGSLALGTDGNFYGMTRNGGASTAITATGGLPGNGVVFQYKP